MNTCETCKFWKDDWCERPEDMKDWNWCQMAENYYDSDTPHQESLSKAEDGIDRYASLRTHKNFGCNQHQPK